jgi:hypothetical protein
MVIVLIVAGPVFCEPVRPFYPRPQPMQVSVMCRIDCAPLLECKPWSRDVATCREHASGGQTPLP